MRLPMMVSAERRASVPVRTTGSKGWDVVGLHTVGRPADRTPPVRRREHLAPEPFLIPACPAIDDVGGAPAAPADELPANQAGPQH
jgi:hypothetical protein